MNATYGANGRDLEGRVVLVTGAAQGIGRAISLETAARGARVVAADINEEGAEETASIGVAQDCDIQSLRCDVTDPRSVQQAMAHVRATYGQLDAAVNNAGIEGELSPTHQYPLAVFDRVLAVNLRGVFIAMQGEIEAMLGGRGGSIVNVSSVAGFRGFEMFSAYNASKHAVIGLTRTAALEYAAQGVRVNSVAPGFCVTPMVTDRGLHAVVGSAAREELEAIHPMRRLGEPEEVARAVAWLCSDASSFTTGHHLAVDGGFLAH